MTDTQHTAGEWYEGETWDGKIAICADVMVLAVNSDALLHKQGKANARRIVAEHNACNGIPTEALEAGVIAEVRDALSCIGSGCTASPDDVTNSTVLWMQSIARQALAKLGGAANSERTDDV